MVRHNLHLEDLCPHLVGYLRLQDSTSWRCLDAVPLVASVATAHQLDRTDRLDSIAQE